MEERTVQQPYDGLHVAHESGLEVVYPGVGAYHSHSTLPEVTQSSTDVWQQHYQQQQLEKDNASHGYNRQPSYPSPAPAYISETAGLEYAGDAEGRGRREKICGMKRKMFFVVLAIVIFLAVAGIAVGVGVSLATRKHSKSSSDAVPSTASGNITCPGSDSQIYQAADTSRFFQVICGVDYSANDGAVDLTSENEDDMAGCIDACAAKQTCTAAGWGAYNGEMVCFLKKSVTNSHEVAGWVFTKEVDDPNKEKDKGGYKKG